MTKSYLALKEYKELGARKGDMLIQSEESSIELNMDKLVKKEIFKLLTDEEAAALYKEQFTSK